MLARASQIWLDLLFLVLVYLKLIQACTLPQNYKYDSSKMAAALFKSAMATVHCSLPKKRGGVRFGLNLKFSIFFFFFRTSFTKFCLYFCLFTSCVGVFGFLFVLLSLFIFCGSSRLASLSTPGWVGWMGSTLLYSSLLYFFNFVFVFLSLLLLLICVMICLMYLLGCDGWEATLLCSLLHSSLLCSPTHIKHCSSQKREA